MAPNATTYAVRFGSIVAGIALFVLLVAPGSRADEAAPIEEVAALREAGSAAEGSGQSPTTVSTTVVVGPSSAPAPSGIAPATSAPAPTSAAKPAGPTTARVLTVFDIVGVPIDRGATWIAIATVTIVDQTGAPAANIDVTGTWTVGPTPASCRTDSSGKCSMYQSPLPADLTSTTITITAPQAVSKVIFRAGN
jgi:hypothetical protein